MQDGLKELHVTQALEGIRILDFSSSVAGPTVTRILGSMGAEVRKVEWPGHPDPMRPAIFATDSERDIDNGSLFSTLSIAKESPTLNAGRPEGMRVVERLIAERDVVIESFSTRMLRRWGLDYERISALHPGVIYLSISRFGRSGPYERYDTWGPTAQAFAGLSATSGLPGYEPAAWGFSYLGICAGYLATVALFAALHARQTTGVGQYIDVAQAEVGISLTGQAMLDTQLNGRSHNRSGFPPGNRGHSDLEGCQEVLRRLGNEGRGPGLRPDLRVLHLHRAASDRGARALRKGAVAGLRHDGPHRTRGFLSDQNARRTAVASAHQRAQPHRGGVASVAGGEAGENQLPDPRVGLVTG